MKLISKIKKKREEKFRKEGARLIAKANAYFERNASLKSAPSARK